MKKYIKFAILLIIGIALISVFLKNGTFMEDPSVFNESTGFIEKRLYLDFHWSTCIGVIGVLFVVISMVFLLNSQKYWLYSLSLTVFLAQFFSWDYFWYSSGSYYYFELNRSFIMEKIGDGIFLLSFFTMFLLQIIMILRFKNNNVMKYYRWVGILSLLLNVSSLCIKTITNLWYTGQVCVAVILILLFMFIIQKRGPYALEKIE